MPIQTVLFPEFEEQLKDKTSSTFEDNMKLPIHRWYRYTAGFSAAWVAKIIEEEKKNNRTHIIDPFVGSGTVAVESTKHDVFAYGLEANPYVYRIASAKLQWNVLSVSHIQQISKELLERAKSIDNEVTNYPPLILKCYPETTLKKLNALKTACLMMDEAER